MLIFLCLGTILSGLTLLILFQLENKRLVKKKYNSGARYSYSRKKLFGKIIFSCFISILVSTIIPSVMWNVGEKEESSAERIVNKERIYYFKNENVYVLKKRSEYVVSLGDSKNTKTFNADQVKVLGIGKGEEPRYEIVNHYKLTRLKSKNSITEATNSMFCFGDDWKETLATQTVNLYVPFGAIKET